MATLTLLIRNTASFEQLLKIIAIKITTIYNNNKNSLVWQYFKNWGSTLWLQESSSTFKSSKHSVSFSLLGSQLSKEDLFSAILGRTYILATKIDQHLLKFSTGQNWQKLLLFSFCSQLVNSVWKYAVTLLFWVHLQAHHKT